MGETLPVQHVVAVVIVNGDNIVAIQNPASYVATSYSGKQYNSITPDVTNPSGVDVSLTPFAPGVTPSTTPSIDTAYWDNISALTDATEWKLNTTLSFKANLNMLGGDWDVLQIDFHLRAIPLHMLLVETCTSTLSLPGVDGYDLTVTAGGGELTFGAGDDKVVSAPGGVTWGETDAEFNLTVTLAGGANYASTSTFDVAGECPIRCLRQLTGGGGYNWIKYQTGSEPAINSDLPTGVDVLTSGALTPTLDSANLSITGLSTTPTYPTTTTFDLSFGVVEKPTPGGTYLLTVVKTTAMNLACRAVTGTAITDTGSGYDAAMDYATPSLTMTLAGGTETWNLDNFNTTGTDLVVSGTSSSVDDLTVTFVSDGDELEDSACIVTVHSSEGHPSCTFTVNISISFDSETLTLSLSPTTAQAGAVWNGAVSASSLDVPDGTITFSLAAGSDISPLSLDTNGNISGTIPDAWGGTTKTFTVNATETFDGFVVGAGTATFDLVVTEASIPDADTDAVILLDRSGTMETGDRWPAAISGAHLFANLIRQTNVDDGTSHRVAVCWFGGWGPWYYVTAADDAKYNYMPGLAGDHNNDLGSPEAGKNFGVLSSLDFANPDTAMLDTINAALTMDLPFGTAIASGLLYARDKLNAQTLGNNKVILALSDGMENRCPLINEVFSITPKAGYEWNATDIKVCSIALDTDEAWADKLREVSEKTNGSDYTTNDVKLVTTASEAGNATNWFGARFADEFGWDGTLLPADPEIEGGQSIPHTVNMTSDKERFFFVASFNQVPPEIGMNSQTPPWTLTLVTPGGGSITASGAGVEFTSGPMYQSVSVKLPLAIPGHEHEWIGPWQAIVSCNIEGTNSYVPCAYTKTRKNAAPIIHTTKVIKKNNTHHEVHTQISQNGVYLDNFTVTGTLTAPGMWGGEALARAASETKLPKPLQRKDISTKAEAALINRGRPFVQHESHSLEFCYNRRMRAYVSTVQSQVPGTYSVHIAADGKKAFNELPNPLLKAIQDLRRYYRGEALEYKIKQLKKWGINSQSIHLEKTTSFERPFVVDQEASDFSGVFLESKMLRLSVTPRNAQRILLGPGWEHAVQFILPRNATKWINAVDSGTGTYYADVKFKIGKNPIFDIRSGILSANEIRVIDRLFDVVIPGQRLQLDRFGVRILGKNLWGRITAPLLPVDPDVLKPDDPFIFTGAITELQQLFEKLGEQSGQWNHEEAAVLEGILPSLTRLGRISGASARSTIKTQVFANRLISRVNRSAQQLSKESTLQAPLSALAKVLSIILERTDMATTSTSEVVTVRSEYITRAGTTLHTCATLLSNRLKNR